MIRVAVCLALVVLVSANDEAPDKRFLGGLFNSGGGFGNGVVDDSYNGGGIGDDGFGAGVGGGGFGAGVGGGGFGAGVGGGGFGAGGGVGGYSSGGVFPGGPGGGGCTYYCKSPTGKYVCCPTNGPKPGECPPVRQTCPRINAPIICLSDFECQGVDKCCFDRCLGERICKSPQPYK